MTNKLSLWQKVSRLRTRLREPEWRRYGTILFTGKLTGLGLLLLAAILLNPNLIGFRAFAADPRLKGNDIVNPINTVWTLIAAFLVFGMQVGFTMLEAGFCRSRETVNVLMECIVDTCLCGILFYAYGFSFMFSRGNGLIGYHWFFLQGAPATYETSGVAFLAFWLFQFAFADTCSTITSGAMIGRTEFVGDLIYSVGVSGFIYPIIGHWSWGPDGFLATMGSGGGTTLLTAQAIGSATITASTFVVALVLMYLVNATGLLRVSAEGETLGLDLHEHGISAYPEYVISSMGQPATVVLEASGKLAPQPGIALGIEPTQEMS
ncbi:MAG: hypothetical protein LAP40_18565 [Acidobacteriia bacterium]|nr:hypothetical protein [Terriglobia bacterium]